jgi:HTH-type transcriptional regulator, competence development regulator
MRSLLSKELRRLRVLKGISLREVEKATGVSNAYLSQLETGKTDSPSPRVLHKLADYYGAPYTNLMEAAGYLQPPVTRKSQPPSIDHVQAALMSAKLTKEEEQTVARFIEFLRAQRTAELNK